ncbi:hypothetical protein BDV34DRAFT_193385 [Aspergillus parasiticus]|uniref:Uncharacterized protein n=1 Tax=Aspergillus parasiticus TaxID=5067 RepID=A0A5N6DNQ8_ASPPA|nr:hypothetical protein BDV34DRAFT_193385 [Aspergillus parasiticus]
MSQQDMAARYPSDMRQECPPGSILIYTQPLNLHPFRLNLEHGSLEINDQFQIEVGDFVARVIPESINMERINHIRQQNSDALFDLLALSATPRRFLYGKESLEGAEERGYDSTGEDWVIQFPNPFKLSSWSLKRKWY